MGCSRIRGFYEFNENLSLKTVTEAFVVVVIVVGVAVVRDDRVALGSERRPGFEVRPLLQLVQVLLPKVELSRKLRL